MSFLNGDVGKRFNEVKEQPKNAIKEDSV